MVLPSGGNGGRNHLFRTLRSPRLNLRNAILLLIVFFIIRNLLKNDYQREEINYLREGDSTQGEMERIVPKAALEREKHDEFLKMKKDIAYLLKEVEELKNDRSSSNENKTNNLGESLRSMDQIHEEKRRMKEEQLLRDHPDFKPSKRLKDLQGEPKTE